MTPHPEKRCSCARCNVDELKQLYATLNRHDLSPHHRLAQARVTVRKLIVRGSDGAGEGLSDHFLTALKDAEGKLRIETAMRREAESERDALRHEVEVLTASKERWRKSAMAAILKGRAEDDESPIEEEGT